MVLGFVVIKFVKGRKCCFLRTNISYQSLNSRHHLPGGK